MPAGNNVGSISIKVTPDTRLFRSELAAQLVGADDAISVPVRLALDENGIAAKVKAATAGLDKDVKIRVDQSAVADLNRAINAVNAKGPHRFKLDVDNEFDFRLRQRLAKINPTVKVKVDVDTSIFDRIGASLSRVSGGRGGGGGLGVFSSFVDNLAVAAAVAAIAAPALALVTGALATLPAIIAGVAAPIGVIALGMDGIKKAAESLSAPLAELKTSISGVFEQRLTEPFKQLAGVMPKLTGPLSSVADGLSDVAAKFIDTIATGPGLANLQGTISNIGKTISTMAPGVGSLTEGLLGLANNVSAKFPKFGDWFNKAADGFANWVDKASKNGSLDRAIENLGGVGKEVLDLVGDLAIKGFEFLEDPKFGQTMKTFVADVRNLVNTLLPGLKNFFTDLTSAIDGVVKAIAKAKEAGSSLPDFVKREAPTPDQQTSGKGNPFTSENAPWRTWFEDPSFATGLSSMIGRGFDAVKPLVVTKATEIATLITPILQSGFTSLTAIATNAWNGLVGVATGIVTRVVGVFAQLPSRIASTLSGIPGAFAGVFASAVAAVASAGAQMVSAIASAVGQIISHVASIPGKVASALGSLAGIGAKAGASLMSGLLSGITAGLGKVLAFASSVAAKIAAVKGPLTKDRTVLTPAGSAMMQGLQDGLEGGFEGVISRAKAMADQLAEAINGGIAGVDQQLLSDSIKKQLDELELQRKMLKVDKDAIPKEDKDGRKAVQSQLDQLQALKDQLALQKEQLGFSTKYGDSVGEADKSQQMLGESLTKMVDIGKGFATANVDQFMSDLGISGQGAIPTIANEGLNFLTSTLSGLITGGFGGGTQINVNSVDEALAAKTTLDNKKALQYAGR